MPSDIEIKLTNFKTYTVAHPDFQQAVDIIKESIDMTLDRGEQTGTLLTGKAGTGKTTICNMLISMYQPPHREEKKYSTNLIIPALYCRVPADTTLRFLAAEILRSLGSSVKSEHLPSLETRLFTKLIECETELVILDELQHLLGRGQEITRDKVCDWIKMFANKFGKPVLLSGLPGCETIVNGHEQLALRYPYRAKLKHLSFSANASHPVLRTTLTSFLTEIASWEYFETIPCLSDPKLERAMFVATGGNMRAIRILLQKALRKAVRRGNHALSVDDFSESFLGVTLATRLTQENPFILKIAELDAIIKGAKRKCPH